MPPASSATFPYVTTPLLAARRPATSTLALLGLLAVTASWGSTFFMLKGVVERVPVPDFLALRFALAAVAVWLLDPRAVSRLAATQRRHGLLLGLAYGAAQLLQTVGLQSTSASVSGFVTGMYVVFTPLLGAVVLRAQLEWPVWAAVGLATVGLAALTVQGSRSPRIGCDARERAPLRGPHPRARGVEPGQRGPRAHRPADGDDRRRLRGRGGAGRAGPTRSGDWAVLV